MPFQLLQRLGLGGLQKHTSLHFWSFDRQKAKPQISMHANRQSKYTRVG
jgi:hypothetical protein